MRLGYADTALGQVHYRSAGAGDPVILLPQAGRSSRMFAPLLPLLAPEWLAIGLDLPGFGPCPVPEDVSIDDLADCLVEALDCLGLERIHLYGLHTGNKIAAAAAVRRPDRVGSLILAGQSHSIIPDKTARNEAIHKVLGRRSGEPRPTSVAAQRAVEWGALYRGIAGIWWSQSLLAGGMREADLDQARRSVLDSLDTMAATPVIYRANFAYDLGAALRLVTVPTLIIEIATPQEDQVIGRQGALVQSLIAESAVVTLEDPRGGIVTLEDRPEDVARAVTGFIEAAGERTAS